VIISTVKELKKNETRVALTPSGVKDLVKHGHKVLIEKGAGDASRFSDAEFRSAGAKIVTASEAWKADMVVKIQKPLPQEYKLFRPGQIIFAFFQLPSAPKKLTMNLLEKKSVAISQESVEKDGRLVLLTPMSRIAGRMAVHMGAYYLSLYQGGRGKLFTGVPGVPGANVLILGAGNVGRNAAKVAVRMGANVTVLSRDTEKLKQLEDMHQGKMRTLVSSDYNLNLELKDADVVISAIMRRGHPAPKIISDKMVRGMKKGSVIIDVAIDQGGSVSTSVKTSHDKPVFERYGVIHYCVENMPAAYPRTSTFALSYELMPYILKIANKGLIKAVEKDPGLAKGVCTMDGFLTDKEVAKVLRLGDNYKALHELI